MSSVSVPVAVSDILGKLIGANMNSTADQTINIISNNYIIESIICTNASASLSLSVGGIYTAISKGGTPIVAAVQAFSVLTSSSKVLILTLNNTDRRTETSLFLSLTTGLGSAATADIYICGKRLDI